MRYLLLAVLLLLGGCATSNTGPAAYQPLRNALTQLPGAVPTAGEIPAFGYPGQVMFGTHAVLPMPGGPKLLNPLAEFLQQNSSFDWLVDVRVQTIHGADYDQLLAEKRSELLASYLQSKGVNLYKLHFQPSTDDGDQLVFTVKSSQ